MNKTSTLLVLLCLIFLHPFKSLSQVFVDPNFNPIIASNQADISAMALQTDGKVLVGGSFQFINATVSNNITRLNPDGTIDPSFDIGKGPNDIIDEIQLQTDGKILVTGRFTTFDNHETRDLVRLNRNGTVDEHFIPPAEINFVSTTKVIMQPDGKILLGGIFYLPDEQRLTSVLRLNTNGSRDLSFASGCSGNFQFGLVLQPDGKIILGGPGDETGPLVIRLHADGTPDNSFRANTGIITQDVIGIAQQDNKILVAGTSDNTNTPLKLGFTKIIRLNQDGSLDNSFTTGSLSSETDHVNSINVLPNKKILLGGFFNTYNNFAISGLVQLNPDGSFDLNFNNDVAAGSIINNICIQNDNKILIAGRQISLSGTTVAKSLFRLQTNGSVDSSFGPDLRIGTNGVVTKVETTSDNKVLVGGSFSSINNQTVKSLARLFPDGRLDESFKTAHLNFSSILHIQKQPDKKILVGGDWDNTGAGTYKPLVRLNPDGSNDPDFNLNISPFSGINGMTLQPDGKILVITANAGSFNYNTIIRLNADGSKDNTFKTGSGASNPPGKVANLFIHVVTVQTDGKILVAGEFETYNGSTKNNIARLLPDGTVDESFTGPTVNFGNYRTVAIQTDNKIIIGGGFALTNYPQFNGIIRLQANGSVDELFSGYISGTPFALLLQPTGKILAGGIFTAANGASRNNVVQFNSNGSIDNSFNLGSGTNSIVNTLAYSTQDGSIYMGGQFSLVNGLNQYSLTRILPLPPVAPTNLTAVLTPPNQVVLAWTDKAESELGYDIQRSTTAGSGFVSIDTTLADVTVYHDKNLPGGTTYYYRVRGLNAGGSSQFTSEVSVTTNKLNQNITFTQIPAKDFGDSPFTLIATASSGLPVIFSLESGPATLTGNQVTITGKGLVRIKASQPGNTNFNPATEELQEFTVHEATPTALTVSNITTTGLKLEWEGTSPEYKILRKTTASSTSPADGDVVYEGHAQSFTYTTELTPNTAYFFTAYGKTAGEASYSSKSKKIATSTATIQNEQTGTAAYLAGETGTKTLPNAVATVILTQASTTDGYIKVTTAANPSIIAALPTGISSVVDKYWQVTGVGLDAQSVKYNLTLDVLGITNVTDFDKVTVLQRVNTNDPWTSIVTSNSNVQQTFQDNKLTLSNLSTFPEIAFGVNAVMGIKKNTNLDFKLFQNYPNPFDKSTLVQYELKKRAEVMLEVIDAQGRVVQKLIGQTQKPGSYSVELDGKALQTRSLYFIRLQANGYHSLISVIYQ